MRSPAKYVIRDTCTIGETGRTLKKRIAKHKLAVKRGDTNNGIAVHAWEAQHHVDWEGAKVRDTEPNVEKKSP